MSVPLNWDDRFVPWPFPSGDFRESYTGGIRAESTAKISGPERDVAERRDEKKNAHSYYYYYYIQDHASRVRLM